MKRETACINGYLRRILKWVFITNPIICFLITVEKRVYRNVKDLIPGDEVAGMVLNFINPAENDEYKRKRGYTEGISVRRPWRRRGLARSLLAQSLRYFKQLGMNEAALGVDTENPSGALKLYESVGFQSVKSFIEYRKPLE